MDAVGQQLGLFHQRSIKINHFRAGLLDDLKEHQPLLVVHHLRSDPKVYPGDRHGEDDIDFAVFGHVFAKLGDHVQVVLDEVLLVRPVLRLGVVGAQLDQQHVWMEVFGLLKLRLVPVGIVAFSEQGTSTDAKVLDLVSVPEQSTHLEGIAVGIVTAGALGDAVAHKGDFDGALGKSAYCDQQGCEKKCGFFHKRSFVGAPWSDDFGIRKRGFIFPKIEKLAQNPDSEGVLLLAYQYFYPMKLLKVFARYISWLAVDVAVGAMAGMLLFERLLHAALQWPAYVLLAMAVWCIYTLDHLLDVREKDLPLSPRRDFHRKNWKALALLLSLTVVSGLVGAFFWFGWGRELQLTLALGILILGSKALVAKVGPGWMKELSIAVFYVVGIAWLPMLRADGADLVWQASLFLPLFMGLAFLNLLMLSYLDRDEDRSAGFFSAASTLPSSLLLVWIRRLAVVLILLSLALFVLLPSFYRPFACLLLLMSLTHYLVFFRAGLSPDQKRRQMEASFALPLLLFLL